ncbi:hypothetical protein CC78DRAFT_4750 [Lojkania enalia]|uniref:Uncharacterized protein n=1 Tax=Lojkania enalia TaxID=147567 RepID=A0A9P4ND20_9PLEO|nr:hypothetical protein CC78DRAFT_4750 [Didymosphaeria enalia]
MQRSSHPSVTSAALPYLNLRTREQMQQSLARSLFVEDKVLAIEKGEQRQSQPASSGRQSIPQSTLVYPTEPSSRSKSPVYLQGKNPYGKILDGDRPSYEKPKAQATRPPSQRGSNIEGRLRTSGPLTFTTRPIRPELDRKPLQSADGKAARPQHLPNPVSVRCTKSFFESKSAESRFSAPLYQASGSSNQGTATNTGAKERYGKTATQRETKDGGVCSTRTSSAIQTQIAPQKETPELTVPTPKPPSDAAKRSDLSQRTNPFVRQKPDSITPKVLVTTATGLCLTDHTTPPNCSTGVQPTARKSSSTDTQAVTRKRSIDMPMELLSATEISPHEPPATPQSIKPSELLNTVPAAVEESEWLSHHDLHEDAVRRKSIQGTMTIAEAGEIIAAGTLKRSDEARHSGANHDIRSANSEFNRQSSPTQWPDPLATKRRPGCNEIDNPRLTHSTSKEISQREPRQRSTRLTMANLDQDWLACSQEPRESLCSTEALDEIAVKPLSHDGVDSRQSFSFVSMRGIGIEEGYQDVKVPPCIDNRGSYGRRKTNDFGYPGARIKPQTSGRFKRVSQDPGNWDKSTCGHFPRRETRESNEDASNTRCLGYLPKDIFAAKSVPWKPDTLSKRGAIDSSTTNSNSYNNGNVTCRCHYHSECIRADRCGDTFAKDLAYILDSLLTEHTSTLEQVISNIKASQTSPSQLRRVPEDLVQRSPMVGSPSRILPCRTEPRRPCKYPQDCSSRQVYRYYIPPCRCRVVCEYAPQRRPISSCEFVPPKAAESLNVGEPGQLVANLNDPPSSLKESMKSVPELISLINSAADDLGVDLQQRPDVQDDQKFASAPVENSSHTATVTIPSIPVETDKEKTIEEFQPSDDTFLEKTRRQLTALSDARSQLMDELDTLAEKLGMQLERGRVSERDIDSLLKKPSKMSTHLSKRYYSSGN